MIHDSRPSMEVLCCAQTVIQYHPECINVANVSFHSSVERKFVAGVYIVFNTSVKIKILNTVFARAVLPTKLRNGNEHVDTKSTIQNNTTETYRK